MKTKFIYLSILAIILIPIFSQGQTACRKPVFRIPTMATTISKTVIINSESKFNKILLNRPSGRDSTLINSGIIFSKTIPYLIEVSVQNPGTVGVFIDVDKDGFFDGAKDYFLELIYKTGTGGVGTVPIPKIYYGYIYLSSIDTTRLATMAILSSNQTTMTKTSFCNATLTDGDVEYYSVGITSCNKQPTNLNAGINDTLCKNASALLMGAFPVLRGSKAYWKSLVPIIDSTNMNQRTVALNTSTEFFLHYYEASTQCEYTDSKWAYVDISPRQTNLTASSNSFCEGNSVQLELTLAPLKDRKARLGNFTKFAIEWWKLGNTRPIETSANDIYNVKTDGSYYAKVGYAKLKDCIGGTKTTTNTVALTYLPKPTVGLITSGSCTNKAKLTATGVNPLSSFSWKLKIDTTSIIAPSDSGKMSYYPQIPGNYFVEVMERGFQCKGISSIITINQTPSISTIYNSGRPLCTGQSDTLKLSASGRNISYNEWYSEPLKKKLAIGNQFVTNISGSYSSKSFGINGCSSDFSKPFTVIINKSVKPKLSYLGSEVSGGITLCAPAAIDLSVRKDSIDIQATQWYINNYIKPTSSGDSYKTALSFTGKIYVKTISLGTLCAALDSVSIDIVDQKPATILTSGSFCAGNKVNLTSTIGNGTKYIWQKDGVTLTAASNSLEIVSNGIYKLEVQIANNLCSKSATFNATFNALPNKPSISGKSEILSGEKIILTASSDTPQPKYQWFRGGFITENTPNLTVLDSGKYQVMVTSIYNCNSLLSNVFEVTKINRDSLTQSKNPTADISGGGILGSDITITVSPNGSTPPWFVLVGIEYDSAGLSQNTDENYVINTIPYTYRSRRAGTYRIKAVNNNTEGNGVAYVYITDKDSSEVFVWNAVSPNGDGKNDAFEIEIPKRLADKTAQIVIFDREGTKLTDKELLIGNNLLLNEGDKMYTYTWDCKNESGELLTPGTYFFSFKVKGFEKDKRASKSGFIEVRR